MTSSLLRWLVFASLCFFAVPARADDAGTRDAKIHSAQGEKLFALGKFDLALDEYQQAFDAKPLGDFLYNIGQCYRHLGDYEQAIFSFKKYLKLVPDAEDRPKVEKTIEDLEERQERGEGKKFVRKDDEREDHPEPSASSPIYKKWWFWTGVAVVGVVGGIGIYEVTKSGGPPPTDLGTIGRW